MSYRSIEERALLEPQDPFKLGAKALTHTVQSLLWFGVIYLLSHSEIASAVTAVLIGYYKEVGEQSTRWHWSFRSTITDMNFFGKHWFLSDRLGMLGWILGAVLAFVSVRFV